MDWCVSRPHPLPLRVVPLSNLPLRCGVSLPSGRYAKIEKVGASAFSSLPLALLYSVLTTDPWAQAKVRSCAFVVVSVYKGVCLWSPLTRMSAAPTKRVHLASCTRSATSARTKSLASRRSGSKRRTRACPAPPSRRSRSSGIQG